MAHERFKTVALFNSKGGVGKSTVTLFLADFFASAGTRLAGRRLRVVVIDLDAQNSSAVSLLGERPVEQAIADGKALPQLIRALLQTGDVFLDDFLLRRPTGETGSRAIALGELHVIPFDEEVAYELEDQAGARSQLLDYGIERFLDLLAKRFDLAFFDMPANVDRRDRLVHGVLARVDQVLVPTEATALAQRGLERTFAFLAGVRTFARHSQRTPPALAGILLNKTNQATRAFKNSVPALRALAARYETPIFDNHLPVAPALANAPDASLEFSGLRERYDTHYDHVRKVARELAQRCGYVVKARKAS